MISSWSGGKDACLALYRAGRVGRSVRVLLNFIAEDSGHCCFHGLPAALLELQAGVLGLPLEQRPMPDDMTGYEEKFKTAVRELSEKYGSEEMVFGDIYLDEHREWVERVCGEVGVRAHEPLWNMPAAEVAREFVDAGFRAIVVSAKADLFGQDVLGREIDRAWISEMTERNICPCGENGEFHTFVFDGPIFRERIEITDAQKLLRDGFWQHWFLDIRGYEAVPKS